MPDTAPSPTTTSAADSHEWDAESPAWSSTPQVKPATSSTRPTTGGYHQATRKWWDTHLCNMLLAKNCRRAASAIVYVGLIKTWCVRLSVTQMCYVSVYGALHKALHKAVYGAFSMRLHVRSVANKLIMDRWSLQVKTYLSWKEYNQN